MVGSHPAVYTLVKFSIKIPSNTAYVVLIVGMISTYLFIMKATCFGILPSSGQHTKNTNKINNNNNNNVYLLQMGCHPVAVITLHVFPNTANKFT
jgi:hypothetical protein